MRLAAAWRGCLAAGLVAIGALVAFGGIAGLAPCGPSTGLNAILAFELARTPAELAALFGQDPCRSILIAAQIRALLVDALLFIPAYAAFLTFAAVALDGRIAARLAMAAVALAALLDEIEGALQYTLLRTLPGRQWLIDLLYWEARTKFVLLGLAGLILAALLAANRRLGAVAAIPVALGSFFSLYFAFIDMHAPQLLLGYRIAWTTLLVVAAIGAVIPRAFSRRV